MVAENDAASQQELLQQYHDLSNACVKANVGHYGGANKSSK